ncbi:MAG: hypothetical protein HC921_02405 [Synechococcaceae cyanobacterium SM2_3_1]|nr:hypothetical protein [Synechococcaceae cyanobacterium SM2_3_1]
MTVTHRFTASDLALMPDDGKLHSAPELIIEVLSPGSRKASRDRLVGTYLGEDQLKSPLFPGFTCPIARLWISS